MKLSIESQYLTRIDKRNIREYCDYVLDKFVSPSTKANCRLRVIVTRPDDIEDSEDCSDLKSFSAWTVYNGSRNGIRKFTIVLNMSGINKRAKNPIVRLKSLFIDLGHELVHVKQYLNNEIFDYVNGDVRFRGKVFDASHYRDHEKYYDSPWELEAYGRESGLYQIFKNRKMEHLRDMKT
jgi:hypothetical protein